MIPSQGLRKAISSKRRILAGVAAAGMAALLLGGSQIILAQTGAKSADNPEPGLSGATIAGGGGGNPMMAMMGGGVYPKPYSKGVRVVGHSPTGGMQLGWVDKCAYVALGSKGVGVIDVSDPAHPRDVGLLTGRGAKSAGENFDVLQSANGRRLIGVGTGYSAGPGKGTPEPVAYYDIFDATDCKNPKHVAEYIWPDTPHTTHFSPDGKYIFATRIHPFSGNGGMHVLDISDLAHPKYVGKFKATAPDGKTWEFAGHNMTFNADGSRLYVGTVSSTGGDFNDRFTSPNDTYSPERVGRDAGGVYIFDTSDFTARRKDPKLRLVGRADDAGWHDVSLATINGVPHLVGAGEAGDCPGTWPRITNIANVKHPRVVGEFRLDMNKKENCPAPPPPAPPPPAGATPEQVRAAGMAAMMATISQSSSHYSSVDSATNTRLGMFQMTGAGFRIADIRNPARPVEIAYFRPGGGCSGFSRYVPATGHIWMTCGQSGFWVLELSPEAKAALKR